MEQDFKSVFNRLSGWSRRKLKGAALTKAITGLVRDDTMARPWLYPVYAAYLLILATPLPFLGASTALVVATALWARLELSPLAKELNRRIKDSFNEKALVDEHREFIEPDPEEPEKFRIKNKALAWHTTKRAFNDTKEATLYAWNALKGYVRG